MQDNPRFRIIVLGAGFSRPAGLPLGDELLSDIRRLARSQFGRENHVERDLRSYVEYRRDCDGISIDPNSVHLEEFLEFLDLEHFLELRGGDTWSDDGNESQVIIKRAIGKIIHNRTPVVDQLPAQYLRFVENIGVGDIILTFNYDILLEKLFDYAGKPYRLFPERFLEIHDSYGTVDFETHETVILKMHGSVDWFSKELYDQLKESHRLQGFAQVEPRDPIFSSHSKYGPRPVVTGPRFPDDPLLKIYRIGGVNEFYGRPYPSATPHILSPSHIKFVYFPRVSNFWRGMGHAGPLNFGAGIIGYSMPEHDQYARIGLYQFLRNYQNTYWTDGVLGNKKNNVKIIDLRTTDRAVKQLKETYRFLDWDKTDRYLQGFNSESIDFFFHLDRENSKS